MNVMNKLNKTIVIPVQCNRLWSPTPILSFTLRTDPVVCVVREFHTLATQIVVTWQLHGFFHHFSAILAHANSEVLQK